jgi:hypothetical protein
MKRRTFRYRGIFLTLVTLMTCVLSTACSSGDSTSSIVNICVDASPQAASGRTVRIGGLDFGPFVVNVNNGTASICNYLCTKSRQRFLEASLPATVSDASGVISTALVNVVACAFAKNSGSQEMTHLFLEENGTLLADPTAGDTRVWATCADLPGGACEGAHAF